MKATRGARKNEPPMGERTGARAPVNEPVATTGSMSPTTSTAKSGQRSTYQRARRDRGEETREQLIQAGLEIFGRVGFEGASTRQIAQAAGANLAAIVYHFGGKEALYVAVAEYIAGRITADLAPLVVMASPPSTPAEARALVTRALEALADLLLGEEEAEKWAKIILREQLQPTSAFDAIYSFMGPTISALSELTAIAFGRAEDDDIRLRVIALVGQVLAFRIANALVLRRMGWERIGDEERAKIKRIVVGQTVDIFDAEAAR